MFFIQRVDDKAVHKVYATKETAYGPNFLIYAMDKWIWVPAKNYKPVGEHVE